MGQNFFIQNNKQINAIQINEGSTIKSDDKFLKKYDTNNNSIWDTNEINNFMEDLENADINGDGKLDNDESISWYAKVTNTTLDKVKSLFANDDTNELYQTLNNVIRENTENIALKRLNQNVTEGFAIYYAALGGNISKFCNNIKELFNTEYAGDKVYRQLAYQQVSSWLLESAKNNDGLTKKEYYEQKILLLESLLGTDKLSEEEQKEIKQAINNIDVNELDDLIIRLTNAENDDYAKMQQDTITNLVTAAQLNKNKDVGFQNNNPNSVGALLQSKEAKEKISFDEIFKLETGVAFNQINAIQEYENKYKETFLIVSVYNNITEINEDLSKNISALNAYNQHSGKHGSDTAKKEVYKNLSSSIISALQKFYGDNEEKINDFLAQYDAKLENDMIIFNSKGMSDEALIDLAKILQNNLQTNLDKLMNGRTLEDYESELKNAYQLAYGAKNSVDLASKFQESQQTGVGCVKMAVGMAGIGICILSNGTMAPMVQGLIVGTGLSVSTLGPGGISYIEAKTKEGGITAEDKAAIIEELKLNGIFTILGLGEGAIASKLGAELLSCGKFISCLSEYGSMAVMGILTDYAIMGDINLSQETISNLINIATGIIAHRKMSNTKEHANTKHTDAQSPQTQKSYSEMTEQELLAEYKRLNAEFADGILDNQAIIDKISQIQQELDTKGLCIKNGKLTDKDYLGVRAENKSHISNYVREGVMEKHAEYELNIDRLPIIKLPNGEILDLNNIKYLKQILSLKDGEFITIGREGDIKTSDNNFISRKHIVIKKENGRLTIQDISSNGTEIIKSPHSRQDENLQTGNMDSNKSYVLNENALPKLKLAEQVEIDLKNYKHQLEALQEGQSITIGREGDIKIDNAYVSATHIVIYKSNGQLKIKDVSTNGTTAQVKNSILNRIKDAFSDKHALDKYTPQEIKIIEQFKNIPEIQKNINNPNKLKKLIKKIDEVINNPEYVSPEMRSILNNGTMTSDGMTIKNCVISDNILNDIVKIAQTGDYITTYTSIQHAFSKTSVGDVAKVGQKLYVNNGHSMELINMSEQTYRELFPPVKRFATHQGDVGTCYLVSTLENLYSSPKGRVEIYRMIGEDKNGIYTKTANSNGQKTYFTRWDSNHRHIKDENGLAIIEQGFCKNTIRGVHAFDPRETIIMEVNEGGWSFDALDGLLGKKPYVTKNKEDFINLIKQHANNKDVVMNCATKSGYEIYGFDLDILNKQYDLWERHEYSIKGYDEATDCVLIANPWHTEAIIKIPLNKFLEYFNEISCIKL